MNNKQDIKQDFVKMCGMIFVNSKGSLSFPFESIEHDPTYDYLVEGENYSVLKSKMSSLIEMINKDASILEKDIETEIWDIL
jgi:hypothetical protein